jgi:tetratricopeptide (TPR) repeat protein
MDETDNSTIQGRTRGTAARLTNLMKRADSLAELGRYDEAIASVEEALAISPSNPRFNMRLAMFYRAQNRVGLAIDAMQRVVERDPGNAGVQQILLRTLIETGRYDEAIDTSHRLLKQSPRSILARDVLGIVYLHQGRLDQALKVTDELIQLAPTDSTNHFKKAVLLQQKGEIAAAMNEFLRSLDLDPYGEMSDDAWEAIAALDSYQLRQLLTVAVEDAVFRAKLAIDAESALTERGYRLSPSGIATLRQINLNDLPGDTLSRYYH